MNNTYNLSITVRDRKVLVKRLEELTGLKAAYTYVPRCAYEIGAFTVERDCSLTVGEDADQSIIDTLLAEEMIVHASTEAEDADEDEAEPDEDTEPEDADEDEAEPDEDTEPEDADEDEAEPDEDTEPEDADEDEAEPDEDIEPEDADEDEAEPDEDTEPEDADEDEAESGEDAEPDNGFPLRTEISLPLGHHTVQTLTNLICMIHSRGTLLSKATGGAFSADQTLVDEIGGHEFRSIYELIAFIRQWEETNPELQGIRFADDKLIFDGFGEAADADHAQAFMRLATAMNHMALTQKRVQAKDVDDSNEKYAMRIWLVRIGFGGADHKTDRRVLMENLSGHSAFRNDEEKAKWTERQKAKREAAKAAKNADADEQSETVDNDEE